MGGCGCGCGCVRCVYPYRWSVCGKRVHQRRVHLSASALRVRICRLLKHCLFWTCWTGRECTTSGRVSVCSTLVQNIRTRRGSKVCITLPIFKDTDTDLSEGEVEAAALCGASATAAATASAPVTATASAAGAGAGAAPSTGPSAPSDGTTKWLLLQSGQGSALTVGSFLVFIVLSGVAVCCSHYSHVLRRGAVWLGNGWLYGVPHRGRWTRDQCVRCTACPLRCPCYRRLFRLRACCHW